MQNGKRVVVVGGGVAGMTAAHELIERGFDVILVERRAAGEEGGRARSFRRSLISPGGEELGIRAPVEHGFRFFPGFYRNLDETMARIPLAEGAAAGAHATVLHNLVHIEEEWLSVSGKPTIPIPAAAPGVQRPTRRWLDLLRVPKALLEVGLTAEDLQIFSDRLWQIATSCADRRNLEYEQLGWREFVESLDRSHEYYWYLASGLTRTLVAAKARKASAKTMGTIALRLLLCLFEEQNTTDRVLNGPTNDAWFGPWLTHLQRLADQNGTYFRLLSGTRVVRAELGPARGRGEVGSKRVVGLHLANAGGTVALRDFDHAIFALSVGAVATLLGEDRELADALGPAAKANISSLASAHVESMHGLQIFVRERLPLNRGHQIFADSPWGLTSIAQGGFWGPGQLPDGIKDVLSIDISSWDLPGRSGGPPAADSSADMIFSEVRSQVQAALGSDFLRDQDIVGWYLDEGINQSEEKVVVNNAGSWALRPEPRTAIENLHLAGDYVRTLTDLACMEGSNESAKVAVNAILAAEGSESRCKVLDPEETEPRSLQPLKQRDQSLFDRGLPWSGLPGGTWAIRTMWAGHTLGSIALAEDQGGVSVAPRDPPLPSPTPNRAPFRLKPELWHPSYARVKVRREPDARDIVAAGAEQARQLRDNEVDELLHGIAAQPGRSDPMFRRWRLSQMRLGKKCFPIPFLVYEGDTLVIHGRARNFDYLEQWTDNTGYRPVYSVEAGAKVGFAELWIVEYEDTVGGLYNEVVLNFVVSKLRRPPYRWRSPYSSIVPMMDSANRLFTIRLLLDVRKEIHPGPIDYGRDLFGMDKRPAKVEIDRRSRTKWIHCVEDGVPVLRARVDETASLLQDVTDSIELSRELGTLEMLKNARQALEGEEIRGGLISPDFRTPPRNGLGRTATIDVQARYKFKPRMLRVGPGDFEILQSKGDNLAHLLRGMGFEAQIATADRHLKSVLFLEGWPSPEGKVEPDRPPGSLAAEVTPARA
jgi:hypothetical protein